VGVSGESFAWAGVIPAPYLLSSWQHEADEDKEEHATRKDHG